MNLKFCFLRFWPRCLPYAFILLVHFNVHSCSHVPCGHFLTAVGFPYPFHGRSDGVIRFRFDFIPSWLDNSPAIMTAHKLLLKIDAMPHLSIAIYAQSCAAPVLCARPTSYHNHVLTAKQPKGIIMQWERKLRAEFTGPSKIPTTE